MKYKKIIIALLVIKVLLNVNAKCFAKYVYEDVIKAAEIIIINNCINSL